MNRQNLFADAPCDSEERGPETGLMHRIFWRPENARMGATLWDLAPGAPGMRLHMHYGAEEMFFVLSGRVVVRNLEGSEELATGDFLFCPEGRAGLHAFSNPYAEPARNELAGPTSDQPNSVTQIFADRSCPRLRIERKRWIFPSSWPEVLPYGFTASVLKLPRAPARSNDFA